MSHVVKNDQAVKNDQVVKNDPIIFLSGQQLPPLFFFSHQQHSQLGFRRMAKTHQPPLKMGRR